MPCNQSNTLKHTLCNSPSPERRGRGEVLERVCSKLGGGLERAIVPVDSSVIPIEGPYTTRSSDLSTMVLRNIDCASLNAEYSLIDRHFSIINDLKTVNNQETDLYFYHSDHLGSSSFITDADGIVSQHLQYLPYGELFAEQRDNTARYYTPYKFSGKEKDEETGYSYFGARYYIPELSIWSAVDPMADKYPGMSAYMYCAGNPVILKDPDGKKIVDANGNEVSITIVNTGENKFSLQYTFAENTQQEVQDEFMSNTGRLFSLMVEIEEGRNAIDKAVKSEEKIHYTIASGTEEDARINEGGEIIGGTTKDIKDKNGNYSHTQITVYEGSAKLWKSKNKFDQNKLTADQKMATNTVHETYHATNQIDIKARKEERRLTTEEHKGAYNSGNQAAFEYGVKNKAYE